MSETLQMAIVGLIGAVAVLYLLRRYLPKRREAASACGSCSKCKGGSCH